MTWLVTNGNGYNRYPHAEDELDQQLAEIAAIAAAEGRPRAATPISDPDRADAPYLTISLGATGSVLVFESAQRPDDDGYSKGPATGDTDEVTHAYGTGTGTVDYERWMLIPTPLAMEAAKAFFRTGQRPTVVRAIAP